MSSIANVVRRIPPKGSAEPREAPDDLTRGRRALRFLARGHPYESHRHARAEPSGKTAGEAARDTAYEKMPDPRKTVYPWCQPLW